MIMCIIIINLLLLCCFYEIFGYDNFSAKYYQVYEMILASPPPPFGAMAN